MAQNIYIAIKQIEYGMVDWIHLDDVTFEASTAVTMNNAVFWDVTPCGVCKNRRSGLT
jgi:hypothetical protein